MAEATNLCYACLAGNVDLVKQMIEKGADVNALRLSSGSAPLHLACIGGKRRVLKLLLRHDALTDSKDNDGRTVLHHAAARANVRTVMDLCSCSHI